MKKPDNIEVRHLFPELYSELITILQNLSPSEWNFPTSSIKWSVAEMKREKLCKRVLVIFLRFLFHDRITNHYFISTNRNNCENKTFCNNG